MIITKPTSSSWIDYLKPNPRANVRLFCFPYAGGGASIFRTWANDVPTGVEVCPVQLPGRESRLIEQPFTRLSSLVQALAQAISPYLDVPFAFFGHSMGALISFELLVSFADKTVLAHFTCLSPLTVLLSYRLDVGLSTN